MLCIDILEKLNSKPLRMFSDKKLREYYLAFETETNSHFLCKCEICIWFEKIKFEKIRRKRAKSQKKP